MRSADEVEFMFFQKNGDNLRTKNIRDSSLVFSPALHVFIRVTPKQIAQEPSVGHISGSHDFLDLVQVGELWGKAAVHAQNLVIDDCSHWEAIKAISKSLPELDVISSLALVVESVDTVDGGALVVASEQEEVLWIFYFICQQQTNSFQRLLSSVDVVPQEQIVRLWRVATVLKQTKKVEILAVHVSADL